MKHKTKEFVNVGKCDKYRVRIMCVNIHESFVIESNWTKRVAQRVAV